jgi:hypothetical protein
MPRARETAISVTTRRAAKQRFHGTATSTISHASAAAPAPMDSTVCSDTPARWPSPAISRAAPVPATILAPHLITAAGRGMALIPWD